MQLDRLSASPVTYTAALITRDRQIELSWSQVSESLKGKCITEESGRGNAVNTPHCIYCFVKLL